MTNMLNFEQPEEQAPIIKVIGVGGGGSNAVAHMYKQGIKGVDFYICNTDAQSLQNSMVPNKIRLGSTGLGAGSNPSIGREAAIEIVDEITQIISQNTSMLFITAGLGGGTGTGAAPVIAAVAKDLGILTVGIVTLPFSFEGRKREQQALAGLTELKKHVDSILVISNNKIFTMQGNISLSSAFGKADDVLTTAAKGIAELITITGHINVDFEDVKTVMKGSGKAIMGSGIADGENRALDAVKMALTSPLLDDTDIKGADNVLLYISSGSQELTIEELTLITDYITENTGQETNIIWGTGTDNNLNSQICITLIATGFDRPVVTRYELQNTNTNSFKPITIEEKQETNTEVKINEPKVNQLFDNEPVKATEPSNITENSNKPTIESNIAEPTIIQPNIVESNIITKNNTTEIESNNNTFENAPKPILVDTQKFEPQQSPQQALFEFEFVINNENNVDTSETKTNSTEDTSHQAELETDRIAKLKNRSFKIGNHNTLEELEKTPAYVRKNIHLQDNSYTNSYENFSRHVLTIDENKTELRANNSFLHDNVD